MLFGLNYSKLNYFICLSIGAALVMPFLLLSVLAAPSPSLNQTRRLERLAALLGLSLPLSVFIFVSTFRG